MNLNGVNFVLSITFLSMNKIGISTCLKCLYTTLVTPLTEKRIKYSGKVDCYYFSVRFIFYVITFSISNVFNHYHFTNLSSYICFICYDLSFDRIPFATIVPIATHDNFDVSKDT